jgi:hypothetical protein
MKKVNLNDAINRVCVEIINDKSYRIGWEANIAMAFKDAFYFSGHKHDNEIVHEVANKAAANFLDQLISKDVENDLTPNKSRLTFDEKGEEELIQGMDKTIIDSSKLRPYNRINVLSSQDGEMSMDDLEEELTKIVFKYASSHMMKKDLELSIKIMGDVIRHPQFYLNI